MVAHPDVAPRRLVQLRQLGELGEQLGLGPGVGQVEVAAELDPVGHGGGAERVERVEPDGLQHLGAFGGGRPEVAVGEHVGVAGAVPDGLAVGASERFHE